MGDLKSSVEEAQNLASQEGVFDAPPADHTKQIFRDAPSPDGKEVKLKDGEVVSGQVWEEVWPNNAKTPTYLLRYNAGMTFVEAAAVEGFAGRLNDYGTVHPATGSDTLPYPSA